MTNRIGHVELMTPDAAGARAFYGSVFNWEFREQEMPNLGATPEGGVEGPPFTYTLIDAGRFPSGGIMPMVGPDWENIPTHWTMYVVVDDLAATVATCKRLNGSSHHDEVLLEGVGKFAILKDPQGAVFCAWQNLAAEEPSAPAPRDPDNAFCWADLATNDVDGARRFYDDLFDSWTFQKWAEPRNGDDFHIVQTGGEMGGGIMAHQAVKAGHMPPAWCIYVHVDNVAAYVEKIVAAGGKVHAGVSEVPGAGTFAVVADPFGATFSLWQGA
jgi:predicted enzyme related to lactoylglutathione lyase